MAELVDAADSKSAVRKDVQVRFLFWAPLKKLLNLRSFFSFILIPLCFKKENLSKNSIKD
jgi:hypothetical protein